MSSLFDHVDLDEAGDDDQELSPEELREQLAAEKAARAAEREANQRNERRLDEMLQGDRQSAPKQAAPLGPAPNPAEDPEGFQRWLAEREARSQRELDARLERSTQEVVQNVNEQSRVQILWSRFQSKYPTYASRSKLVEAAYANLVNARTLPSDTEGAVDAVKREMDSMAGMPLDARAPGNETEDLGRHARPNLGRRRKEVPEEKPVTLGDAIYAKQVHHGLRSA